jgi:hypothetical protein
VPVNSELGNLQISNVQFGLNELNGSKAIARIFAISQSSILSSVNPAPELTVAQLWGDNLDYRSFVAFSYAKRLSSS